MISNTVLAPAGRVSKYYGNMRPKLTPAQARGVALGTRIHLSVLEAIWGTMTLGNNSGAVNLTLGTHEGTASGTVYVKGSWKCAG